MGSLELAHPLSVGLIVYALKRPGTAGVFELKHIHSP